MNPLAARRLAPAMTLAALAATDLAALERRHESSTRDASAWPERLAQVGLSALVECLAAARRTRQSICVAFAQVARCSEADRPEPAVSQAAAPDTADADDWSDVCRARDGDHEAYARLVRRYQEPIAAYMWRFTRDRRQWEELVHDVFVEAYFSLGGYAARAPLVHWLKRIATRVGYRWWETRQLRGRELPLSSRSEASPASRPDAARDAAELVHRLLARLAPRDRLVITLLYLESNSVAEVARLTGWSESLVKVQAHRARKRLAKICALWEIEL